MIADAVAVESPLGEPAGCASCTWWRRGQNFTLRDAPNQEVSRRADGKFDVALHARPGLPVMPTERAAALRDDGRADIGNRAIADLSRQLTAGADRVEQVGRLVDWVFRNLSKTLSSNLTTASQVLTRRAGDCTEHAALVRRVARAAGIPAREVSGSSTWATTCAASAGTHGRGRHRRTLGAGRPELGRARGQRQPPHARRRRRVGLGLHDGDAYHRGARAASCRGSTGRSACACPLSRRR